MKGKDIEKRTEKRTEERPERRLRPLYRVHEADGKVIVELEMPGVTKDGLEIKIENNELHILGKREPMAKEGEYLIKERRDGDFYRVFTLDNTIDQDKIEASLNNGLLTITLGLKESEKPKLITVKTG